MAKTSEKSPRPKRKRTTKKTPKKITNAKRLKDIRRSLARIYGSKCYVCHRKFGARFTFHHLWYEPVGDAIYHNFKTPLQYYEALQYKIREKPHRFLLLCNTHHRLVEYLSHWDDGKYKRARKAVLKTQLGEKYKDENFSKQDVLF